MRRFLSLVYPHFLIPGVYGAWEPAPAPGWGFQIVGWEPAASSSFIDSLDMSSQIGRNVKLRNQDEWFLRHFRFLFSIFLRA